MFSAQQPEFQKLINKKKVVNVVDGEGSLGNGDWGNLIEVSEKQFLQRLCSPRKKSEDHSTCSTERIEGTISSTGTPSSRISAASS